MVWSVLGPQVARPVVLVWRVQRPPVEKPQAESSKEQRLGAQQGPGRKATSSSAMVPWYPSRRPWNSSWGQRVLALGPCPAPHHPGTGPHLVLGTRVHLVVESGPGLMPAIAMGA